MKVAFVLTAHLPNDERVWFQEAQSLIENGFETFIISTNTNEISVPNTYCFDDIGMSKKEVIKRVFPILDRISPDIIICDNPIAILAARYYKKNTQSLSSIIYDVTEWYPSKKNLRGLSLGKKVVKGFVLSLLSLYAAWFLDGFIFGECDKAKPFRLLFPWKKYIYLPYYADVNQIKTYPLRDISAECVCLYSGPLTEEKGFFKVLNVLKEVSIRFPETKFILRIISSQNIDSLQTNNFEVQQINYLPFQSFCEKIGKADLFFDLRKNDFENTRCLPIKLFYYMAAGRPVIYSDLRAIKQQVPEINETGVLVDPENTEKILSAIYNYINDKKRYQNHCERTRELAEQKYNWAKVSPDFVEFVKKIKITNNLICNFVSAIF